MSDKNMQVEVDQDACIGCTLCTQICPDVFEIDDNGKAKVSGKTKDTVKIKNAAESCPVQAIKLKM